MQTQPSHLTRAILAELEDLRKAISDDVSQRSKARRAVANLLQLLQQNDTEGAARVLNKQLHQVTSLYPHAKATLEKLRIDLNRRQDEELRTTYGLLENYCRAEEIPLKGRPPKYTADHLLEIQFDRQKNRTKVGIQSLQTLRWQSVAKALDEERARLWGRPFDESRFRDRLVEAYEEVEGHSPSPTGWASLDDVYQVLRRQVERQNLGWRKGGRLVAYYKDEFSADLSMLWQAQASANVATPRIEFSAIRDPRRAYKVVQPDDNVNLYGFLRPRGVW